MTISLPPTTGLPTIGITVFDSATVFDGLTPTEVIYRYDLPGEGITSGWAGTSVVEQVRTLAGEKWPDIEVAIDADDTQTDALVRLLATKAVAARPAGELAPEQEPESEAEAEPVRTPGRHRLDDDGPRVRSLTIAAIVLAGVVLAGLAALAFRSDGSDPSTPATGSSVAPAPSTSETPAPLVLDEVSVELPEGYSLDREDDVVRATGPDPELRIFIAVDPLYSIGADALFPEIARLVERDDELSDFVREGDTVTYQEDPGDGSRVRWTTWVEGANQVSVGCHTRQEPTAGQHATCTIATGTVSISGGGTEPGATESKEGEKG